MCVAVRVAAYVVACVAVCVAMSVAMFVAENNFCKLETSQVEILDQIHQEMIPEILTRMHQ